MNWIVKTEEQKAKTRKRVAARKADYANETPTGITLQFLAVDGKAMAIYRDRDGERVEVQVNSREHAVKLSERAVANANQAKVSFRIDHGVTDWDTDPMNPTVTQTCLSLEAYEAVKTVERKAKFNRMFEMPV